jgi:hypothetical protein
MSADLSRIRHTTPTQNRHAAKQYRFAVARVLQFHEETKRHLSAVR